MSELVRRLGTIEQAIKALPTETARAGMVAQVDVLFPEDHFAEERPRIVDALLTSSQYAFEGIDPELGARSYLVQRGRHGEYTIYDNPPMPTPPVREEDIAQEEERP